MAGNVDPILRLVTAQNDAARRCGAALADVFKALKAISFYPKGHPLRAENLQHAHQSIQKLLKDKELSLVINRNGFVSSDGGAQVDNNPMALALARELFIRRVQRLTFLDDLTADDLKAFLFVLTTDPQKVSSSGDFETLMRRNGIKTIWVNEIDLSVIWEKRQAMEASGETPGNIEEMLTGHDLLESHEEPEMSIEELLVLLENEHDDNRYLQLARTLAENAESYKTAGNFWPLLPVMDALLGQNADAERSPIQREYAVFTLEQIASGRMGDFLILQLENREYPDKETIHRIFKQLGEKIAYVIIQRLCVANGLLTRKALATALVRIGVPALPALLAMLRDERWYVVRNMVAILGELGCGECVADLRGCVNHEDQRVRKEAIRSLMNIGGKDAEAIIIGLLDDNDDGIVRQAILSLGIMKSHQAVQPLLEIIAQRDMLLQTLPLKIEALQAIGRIGDRRATSHLVEVLQSSYWLAWKKGDELKIVTATALGQIGDESSLPALKAKAAKGGDLGIACSEAIDNIERLAESIYG